MKRIQIPHSALPPTDIDTDSEAKKKKKKESGNIFDFLSRVWQLGGTPINHIHVGQRPPVQIG